MAVVRFDQARSRIIATKLLDTIEQLQVLIRDPATRARLKAKGDKIRSQLAAKD